MAKLRRRQKLCPNDQCQKCGKKMKQCWGQAFPQYRWLKEV